MYLDNEEQQIDCQSTGRFESANYVYFRGANLYFGMPCPGQCLNVGRGSSDIVEEIVALQADASAGLGRLHAQLQKFSAHTKPPEKSRCVAVDLSSPQAVTDQIARTSPTASEK